MKALICAVLAAAGVGNAQGASNLSVAELVREGNAADLRIRGWAAENIFHWISPPGRGANSGKDPNRARGKQIQCARQVVHNRVSERDEFDTACWAHVARDGAISLGGKDLEFAFAIDYVLPRDVAFEPYAVQDVSLMTLRVAIQGVDAENPITHQTQTTTLPLLGGWLGLTEPTGLSCEAGENLGQAVCAFVIDSDGQVHVAETVR